MELRQLRQFIAVAEELHFARAAQRLGMEQSPLSHSIRNLEADLQVKLFHRTTRRTWLTWAGTRLFAEAKRILTDIDSTIASLQADGEEPPVLRLALGEDLAGEPFTRFLFQLEHHRPSAKVEVRELTHTEAARLVRDGGADVALTLDRRPADGLEQRRGWGEPLMLIVPIGHLLADREQVQLADIGAERVALPRSSNCPGYLGQIEDLFRRHRVGLTNRITVRHWNTAVSFAATGRAVALCPASFVNGATTVAVVPIAARDAELVTWLLYSGVDESPVVALFLDVATLVDSDEVVAEAPEPDA